MIVFSSVSKQFIPDEYALKDVSFEISPGEFVLLTGPSGSGKTTVMKLLTKEYVPSSGKIEFHAVDLNDIKDTQIHEHRRKIGVVFQDYNLIPELNVWENIALPLSIIGKNEAEIEERVTDLLELISLTDKALFFPKQLSGGEAQRIGIARALSTAPSVIFADEPTGNLDQENSLQIAKLLTKINELGTTVLFATHDHDVIDVLKIHRHIVLENGQLKSDTADKHKKKKREEETEKNQVQNKITNDKETETKVESHPPSSDVLEQPAKSGFFSKFFGIKKTSQKISLKDEQTSESDLIKEKEEKIEEKTKEKKVIKSKKKQ